MGSSTVSRLAFHGIGTPQRLLEDGEDRYWITDDTFEHVLDLVADDPLVELSFDDGNLSDIERGLPGLLERGLTATFFLIAGRLDEPGAVTQADVAVLVDNGMTIGSHGWSHRPWRGLDAATTVQEFDTARSVLAEVAGHPVGAASCPLGQYDRGTLQALRRRGYEGVYTSDWASSRADSWLRPRFSLRAQDTIDDVHHHLRQRDDTWRRWTSGARVKAKSLR